MDREIARLAERQHGVVATRQLAALGLSRGAVAARAAAGRLHRIHRGVYAVGHPLLPRYGRWMAAVLAAGPGAALAGTTVTRSALEEAFLALCADQALERPHTNARVCGLEVDFLFAAQRLVVEADSWRFHRTRQAFERDRQRDAILARAGYRTIRVTHRQITRRPSELVAAITAVGGGATAPAIRSSA